METFWLFIRSNLSKFNVNGGKASLIERIKIFYDPTYTSKDEDPKPIVDDIPFSIENDAQLRDILSVISKFERSAIDINMRIWSNLFNLPEEHRDEVLKFLKENDRLLLNILIEDPSKINYFSNDTRFIRVIWADKIYNSYKHYKIILGMLRHSLIPENQFNEFVNTVTDTVNTSLFIDANETELSVLENSGFFKEFYELAFTKLKISNFDWARENKILIVQYIKRYGLDDNIVNAFNQTFRNSLYPWKLQEALDELFQEEAHLEDRYMQINEEIDGELPAYLFQYK